MFPHTVNPDLVLELLEERHAEELFALTDANRTYLRQWLPWLDAARSAEDTRAFIAGARRQLADNNGFQTVIRYHGGAVGVIGHHRIDWENKSCSLGYWLAEHVQGHGIMTTCCRVYVDHALRVLGLNRVEIRCAEGNLRSRAIPERLGFKPEGVLREAECLYGSFVDSVVYAALASDWDGNAGSR